MDDKWVDSYKYCSKDTLDLFSLHDCVCSRIFCGKKAAAVHPKEKHGLPHSMILQLIIPLLSEYLLPFIFLKLLG